MDYFEYKKLSRPFRIFYFRSYPSNKFYGINKAVSIKINKRLPKYSIIEHGVYFDNSMNLAELKYFENPVIYTMGKQRMEFLTNNGIQNVYSIGPYIKYVRNFKTKKKREDLKTKLGKTLLVFPSHSIEGVDSVFNEKSFLNEIKECSKDFQTTLICMYWKDILDNRHIVYQNDGFVIVTAGYRNDPFFLSRLKDLIELSDMTMSNNLGTHIGYSIALNKPHYLFKQKCFYKGEKLSEETKHQDLEVMEFRKELFYKAFGHYMKDITKDQIELVKYYWGDF